MKMDPKKSAEGLGFVIAYVLICSVRELYFSSILKSVSLSTLLFFTFSISTFVFCVLKIRRLPRLLLLLKSNFMDFVKINFTTALMWAAFLYALKWIQPAAVASINAAMGPIVSVLLSTVMLEKQQTYRSDKIAALGVLFSVAYLVKFLLGQAYGSSVDQKWNIVFGILCAIVSGSVTAINNIYAKRISNAGVTAAELMCFRFILLILVSACFAFSSPLPEVLNAPAALNILIVAFAGMITPIYFLQLGIAKSNINSVALLVALGPLLTFVLQKTTNGIPISVEALVGILGVSVSVIVGIIIRTKVESGKS